jgi:hypothetical protein
METRHSTSGEPDSSICKSSSLGGYYRPPPLRTSNTYDDDDDAFNKIALNLLSRYETLDRSASDALHSTLLSPQDRVSFLEALLHRKNRLASLSPTTASLIQEIDRALGYELRTIVEAEHVTFHRQNHQCSTSSWSRDSSGEEGGSDTINTIHHGGANNKKRKARRFFPDTGDAASVFFRSRRVQNIDWKLVEMAQQVQSLQLDGNPATASSMTHCKYEPPNLH